MMKKFILIIYLTVLIFCNITGDQNKDETTSQNTPVIENTVRQLYLAVIELPDIIIGQHKGIFLEESFNLSLHGEMLIVSGSWNELLEDQDPIMLISDFFYQLNWQQEIEYSADSPDGTFQIFSKKGIWAFIRGNWDGGDITDPTYIASDVYQIVVICGKILE